MSSNNQYDIIKNFKDKVKFYFKDLTFIASSHEYFIKGIKNPSKSVSGKIKAFVEEKDWDAIADRKAKRTGVTKQSLLDEWKKAGDEACERGSDVHDYGEHFQTEKRKIDDTKKLALFKFWQDLEREHPGRYILVGKEVLMYHLKYLFPGTCDFVLFDRRTKTYIIGDYKTNKDLYKNFAGEMLLAPFGYLLNCPFNHYQIQLSYYQILLEQILGFKVSDRWLVWLKEDGNYETLPTFDFREPLLAKEISKAN